MRYEVTVTLHIEAESENQADNRAHGIINYGGCNDEYFLGWDLEEIEEARAKRRSDDYTPGVKQGAPAE